MAGWLCPTERDRARVLDNTDRVLRARAIAAAAMGVTILVTIPWTGWWTVPLFAIAVVTMGSLNWRMRRSERPERAVALTLLVISLDLALGAAISGGSKSPVLAWLVVPAAMTAIRFRTRVVVVGAVITACEMVAVSALADPAAMVDDPRGLLLAISLLVAVIAVTSALTGAEMKYREESVLDPLTGLLNRSGLEGRFAELREQAVLLDTSMCLLACDLDGFKRVNDTYGHERGDDVLRAATYEMRKELRSFELFYRLGGEEFVVLLPGMEVGGGLEIAERLRLAVDLARPGGVEITMSVGVAAARTAEISYEALFQDADRALYEAKAAGRNRVVAAGESAPRALMPA